ncbi:MAG: thermonuclease family protein [Ramlibacter sp.]|nr:thermonuclease family protein [Ramlibacter sp.]
MKAPPRSAFGASPSRGRNQRPGKAGSAVAPVLALLLLVVSGWADARTLKGRVTHVTDGDTIWVRPAGAGAALQVRLQGIDAPEICQAFGVQARDALAARLLHRPVEIDVRAQDKYERTLARVSVKGQDVGSWLVADGWAWSSGFRRHAGPYAKEQQAARSERRGLWVDAAPLEPRTFRKQHGSCYPGP